MPKAKLRKTKSTKKKIKRNITVKKVTGPAKKHKQPEEKIIVVNYYKENGMEATIEKFDVSRSAILSWEKKIENGESLESKSGHHFKTQEYKDAKRDAKFFDPNQDISKLTKEELIEFGEFWATVGKWRQGLAKKK